MTTIYTNGKSLFTLENYAKRAISDANSISIHSEVSNQVARAMHERGKIYYIFGIGDRKELKDISLNRKMKFQNFTIN